MNNNLEVYNVWGCLCESAHIPPQWTNNEHTFKEGVGNWFMCNA